MISTFHPKSFEIIPGLTIGQKKFILIAGPCVIESEKLVLTTAEQLREITAKMGIPLIFKSSFDKANRTSSDSFRGLGFKESLRILKKVKTSFNVPILTDVHECEQVDEVAAIVDVLQIPAFLCRQTDLIHACAKTGKAVNIKKGQYMAPEDMKHAVEKCKEAGNTHVFLTERGSSFGYHNLVVDMRSLPIMRQYAPVVFDATPPPPPPP